MMFNVILVFALLHLTPTYSTNIGELVQVSIVHRHGARNPHAPYPNDPWKSPANFPEGWMELTLEGQHQMEQLGQLLRLRYANFLSTSAKDSKILMRSTNTTRTIESALNMILGLFPNQSVPLYVMQDMSDDLFNAYMKCPAYGYEMEAIMKSSRMIEEEKERREVFDWIGHRLGIYVKDVQATEMIYSTFFIENRLGFVLPSWTRAVFPEKMRTWAAESMVLPTSTVTSGKLRYGTMFKDIFEQAADANTTKSSKKFLSYSCHDKNIAGMLALLKSYNYDPPGFAAAIIFEIYKNNITDMKYVRMFYRNNTDSNFLEIFHPKCESPCSLPDIRYVMDNYIPKNINDECKRNESDEVFHFYDIIIPVLCVSFFVLGSIATMIGIKIYGCTRRYSFYNSNPDYESL